MNTMPLYAGMTERRSLGRRARFSYLMLLRMWHDWLIRVRWVVKTAWAGNAMNMHFWLSVGQIVYGVWILLPFACISPPVTVLKVVVPEPLLGAILLIVGNYGLHCMALTGMGDGEKEYPICRASRYNAGAYLTLFIACCLSNWQSLSTIIFGMAALRALWTNRRLCHCRKPEHPTREHSCSG